MSQQLTYRRLRDEIFWHLYQECKYWPTEEVTTEHPPGGAFCPDCLDRHTEEFRARLGENN